MPSDGGTSRVTAERLLQPRSSLWSTHHRDRGREWDAQGAISPARLAALHYGCVYLVARIRGLALEQHRRPHAALVDPLHQVICALRLPEQVNEMRLHVNKARASQDALGFLRVAKPEERWRRRQSDIGLPVSPNRVNDDLKISVGMCAPERESISSAGLEHAKRLCNGLLSIRKMQMAERAYNMIQ